MTKKDKISNDLYDLIKVCGLPDKQNDGWAKLSRKFGEEAKINFKKLLKGKTIEVNHDGIKIGRDIKITVS